MRLKGKLFIGDQSLGDCEFEVDIERKILTNAKEIILDSEIACDFTLSDVTLYWEGFRFLAGDQSNDSFKT